MYYVSELVLTYLILDVVSIPILLLLVSILLLSLLSLSSVYLSSIMMMYDILTIFPMHIVSSSLLSSFHLLFHEAIYLLFFLFISVTFIFLFLEVLFLLCFLKFFTFCSSGRNPIFLFILYSYIHQIILLHIAFLHNIGKTW